MFKYKEVLDAEFYRTGTFGGIKVFLAEGKKSIYIYTPISSSAKLLSERELEEVVEILSHKAKVMLKQRNFPPIYDEMLSELKNALEERYG